MKKAKKKPKSTARGKIVARATAERGVETLPSLVPTFVPGFQRVDRYFRVNV